ncbi:MAG: NAD(P)/FAD-dependent oxidoreductase, partial [Phycisphaerae bacterium]
MDNKRIECDICIAGCGPSAMMAAIEAAGRGLSVVNVEQTAQPARKLLITGGGHCNITNNLPAGDFLD